MNCGYSESVSLYQLTDESRQAIKSAVLSPTPIWSHLRSFNQGIITYSCKITFKDKILTP